MLKIGPGLPSERAIAENANALGRYASICQENGLVPIVEPEITLGPGDYTIERAAYESERVLSHVFRALNTHDVMLEAMLLKPSMVLPGLDASLAENDPDEVARLTVQTMMRSVPPAVPGIHFLSGGMGAEEATQNLQQLQKVCPQPAPWALCVFLWASAAGRGAQGVEGRSQLRGRRAGPLARARARER